MTLHTDTVTRNHTPAMADIVSGNIPEPQTYGRWLQSHADVRGDLYMTWYLRTPAGRDIGADRTFAMYPLQSAASALRSDILTEGLMADMVWLVLMGSRTLCLNADGTRSMDITENVRFERTRILEYLFSDH